MTATLSPRPSPSAPAANAAATGLQAPHTRSSATVSSRDVHRRSRALHQPRDGSSPL